MAASLTPIPGLRQSVLFDVAVALYQRHRVEGERGVCGACGQPAPCPAGSHAALVISAAEVDPQQVVDGPPRGYTGYRVGGRGRPVDESALMYERDDG